MSHLTYNTHYAGLALLLERIEALFDVATSADTTEISPKSIIHYFWVLDDLLQQAKIHCHKLSHLVIQEGNHVD